MFTELEKIKKEILDKTDIKNVTIKPAANSLLIEDNWKVIRLLTENDFIMYAKNLSADKSNTYLICSKKYLTNQRFKQVQTLAKNFKLKIVVSVNGNLERLINYIKNGFKWKENKVTKLNRIDTTCVKLENKNNEKEVSYIVQSHLSKLDENIRTEYSTKFGRIDILTNNYIIEVKHLRSWKSAIGQLICYNSCLNNKRKPILYTFTKRHEKKELNKQTKQQMTDLLKENDIIWIHHNWKNQDNIRKALS